MDSNRGFPVVVIGASAGGIQALLEIVAAIPASFPGPILVVVHIGRGQSVLPRLIQRAGVLPASHPRDGEVMRPGHVYVAPPDVHMLARPTHIELHRGPRENHSRPSIDPLFRTAATAFGPRTIAVILSGALSDGANGLLMVKRHGGTVIVQDPESAIVNSMPASALRVVEADYVLSARQIGAYLSALSTDLSGTDEEVSRSMSNDADMGLTRQDSVEQDQPSGRLTMFTCPSCGGTLWQSTIGSATQFRCPVGHTWATETLLGTKSEELEAALWASVRLLEERATLSRQLAARVRAIDRDEHRAADVEAQATLDERRADAVRELLQAPLNLTLQMICMPVAQAEQDG